MPVIESSPIQISEQPQKLPSPKRVVTGTEPDNNLRAVLVAHATAIKRFKPLLRYLDLSENEFAILGALLADREMAKDRIRAQFLAQGNFWPTSEQISRAEQEIMAPIDEDISTLLGTEREQLYQAYRKNSVSFGVAEAAESKLSYSDEPLTPEQTARLKKILAHAANRESFVVEAKQTLSPLQLAALQESIAVHDGLKRMQEIRERVFKDGKQ
ncbi:hypothetical protein [Oleiharenicola lentus]|uniref:hypothetical protein n=1 Tax=Oleiharenicola lentus TaxID=2508720 RepID=UPI003F66F218